MHKCPNCGKNEVIQIIAEDGTASFECGNCEYYTPTRSSASHSMWDYSNDMDYFNNDGELDWFHPESNEALRTYLEG